MIERQIIGEVLRTLLEQYHPDFVYSTEDFHKWVESNLHLAKRSDNSRTRYLLEYIKNTIRPKPNRSIFSRSLRLLTEFSQVSQIKISTDSDSSKLSSNNSKDFQEQIDSFLSSPELEQSFESTVNKLKSVKMSSAWYEIKKFSSADGNIKPWLRELELLMELDEIPESKKLTVLNVKLSEEIHNFLDTLSENDINTYTKLKNVLIGEYTSRITVKNAQARIRGYVIDHRPDHFFKSASDFVNLVAMSVPNMDKSQLLEHQLQILLPFLKGKTWQRLHDKSHCYQTVDEALYDLEMVIKLDKHNEKRSSEKTTFSKSKFDGECNYCHKRGHKKIECKKRIYDEKKNSGGNQNSFKNNAVNNFEKVNLPLIEIGINKANYTALVDTGANVEISRQSVVIRHGYKILPYKDSIRQALGTKAEVLGKAQVHVRIRDKIHQLELLCVKDEYVDEIYDIILGVQAITKFNLKIDLAKQEIVMDNRRVDLIQMMNSELCNLSSLRVKEPVIDKSIVLTKLCGMLSGFQEFINNSASYVESIFSAPRQQFTTNTPHKFIRYQVPIKLKKYIDEELDYLIENKIIIPSDTPFLHNLVLVKKSDDTYRACIDMRPTNQVTVVDQYPVADLRETLTELQGYTLFSTIDIKKAFQLINIHPEDQHRFGLYCHRGTFQYTKLAFGFVNSAQIFQRSIDSCLIKKDLNIQHHLETVASVFSALMEYRLAVNFNKCNIACEAVEFLNHLINKNGLSPSYSNIECIKNLNIEKTVTGIKRFLGATGFFSNLIPNYSYLCQPLTDLLSPKNKFVWTLKQDKAIDDLKSVLSKSVVAHPDFNKPFEIYIDSSLYHHGAVIMQRDINNVLVPIRFWSMKRKFTKKFRSSVYVELEGIVQLCRKFKYYLLGNKNIVYTDHKELLKIIASNTNLTFSQWLCELQSFQITFKYVPGFKNTIADLFSRPDSYSSREEEKDNDNEDSDFEVETNQEFFLSNNLKINTVIGRCFTSDYLIEKQSKDRYLTDENFCKKYNIVKYNGIFGVFKDNNKKLFIPFLPDENLYDTCFKIHEMGHFKMNKLIKLINLKWFNPKIQNTLREIERKCKSCAKTNIHHQPKVRKMILLYDYPRIAYSVDLAGPWNNPLSKYKYICMVIDIFSRFWMVMPLIDSSFVSVAKALKTIFNRYGLPKLLQRAIRGLEEMITKSIKSNEVWDEVLDDMVFYYNVSPNITTGVTPYELFFATKCHLPYEWTKDYKTSATSYENAFDKLKLDAIKAYNEAYVTLLNSRLKYARDVDLNKYVIPVGSYIYIKRAVRDYKLNYHYEGPFVVVKSDFLSVSYKRLEKDKFKRNGIFKCHISLVKVIDNETKKEIEKKLNSKLSKRCSCGRPRKKPVVKIVVRKRGRPRKVKRGPGRPRKFQIKN